MSEQDNALTKVNSFQYPNAHYGHLSPQQNKSLDEFRHICQDKGYYRPAGPGVKSSHDDETLLRYLRARKFVPQEAFGQFKDTEDWRKEQEIDKLYETIDVDGYDETRRLYPQWTGRRDKRGIPVYVFEVAELTAKKMAAYEKSIAAKQEKGKLSPKLLHLFALYENLTTFTMPLCSAVPNRPFPETPVSQSNNIVDISRVGLKQFWNLKGHMQDASTLATAHYPETLDRIFIIGAPSFFPTVWSWIKRWFDPITVSKIFILSQQDMAPTLEKYIEKSNIPKRYGGTLDWEWGRLPSLEPAISNALDWDSSFASKKSFPNGPIYWRKTDDGKMNAYAVGSVAGKQRKDLIATIHKPQREPSEPQTPAVSGNDAGLVHTSTTGEHTHPAAGQDYFPTSGQTPPEHAKTEDEAMNAGDLSGVGATAGAADAAITGRYTGDNIANNQTVNHADKSITSGREGAYTTTTEHPNPNSSNLPLRTGTSSSRFEAQDSTHAEGMMSQGTPAVVDHGHGDKSSTMEPNTVGLAPKDVSVPEITSEQTAPSYLEQAKSAAGAAIGVVENAGASVIHAVGYGGHEEKPVEPLPKSGASDSRVDKMEPHEIEDYLRAQYTSTNRVGDRQADKLMETKGKDTDEQAQTVEH